MRKLAIVALTAMTALACAAVAMAQSAAPTIDATLSITPENAGTKAKPANALVEAVFNINQESESTLRRIEYTIPKDVKLNGKGFKTCSEETIGSEGESACPKGSKVGTGAATALLGPNKTPIEFNVGVYVASAKALTLSLTSSVVPQVVFTAQINGQVVGFDIPTTVQQPVPNLYSYVTSVTARLGKQEGVPATTKVKKTVKVKKNGKTKKKKKTVTVPFASLVGCPSGGHQGSVKAFLANNPDPPMVDSLSADATAPCSK